MEEYQDHDDELRKLAAERGIPLKTIYDYLRSMLEVVETEDFSHLFDPEKEYLADKWTWNKFFDVPFPGIPPKLKPNRQIGVNNTANNTSRLGVEVQQPQLGQNRQISGTNPTNTTFAQGIRNQNPQFGQNRQISGTNPTNTTFAQGIRNQNPQFGQNRLAPVATNPNTQTPATAYNQVARQGHTQTGQQPVQNIHRNAPSTNRGDKETTAQGWATKTPAEQAAIKAAVREKNESPPMLPLDKEELPMYSWDIADIPRAGSYCVGQGGRIVKQLQVRFNAFKVRMKIKKTGEEGKPGYSYLVYFEPLELKDRDNADVRSKCIHLFKFLHCWHRRAKKDKKPKDMLTYWNTWASNSVEEIGTETVLGKEAAERAADQLESDQKADLKRFRDDHYKRLLKDDEEFLDYARKKMKWDDEERKFFTVEEFEEVTSRRQRELAQGSDIDVAADLEEGKNVRNKYPNTHAGRKRKADNKKQRQSDATNAKVSVGGGSGDGQRQSWCEEEEEEEEE